MSQPDHVTGPHPGGDAPVEIVAAPDAGRYAQHQVTPPPWGWAVPPPPPRRGPWHALAAPLALTVAAVALAGVPFGVLWSVVAPDVPLRAVEGGVVYLDAQPEQVIAADGWFAILGVPFGVLLAAGVWLAGRRRRGVLELLALIAGAALAGLVAWQVGRRFGLAGFRESLATAEAGDQLARPADLSVVMAGWWPPHLLGVLLVPALAAVATYTLAAAWSKYPTLRPHEYAEPESFSPPPRMTHPNRDISGDLGVP